MRVFKTLLSLNVVVLVSLFAIGCLTTARGEQPSTVFVLDTSDSDSAPVSSNSGTSGSNNADLQNDSSTRIISDESLLSHRQKNQTQDHNSHNQRHTTTTTASSVPNTSKQPHHSSSSNTREQTSSHPVTSRRLEEAAHVSQVHKSTNQQAQRQLKTTTTTANPYENEQSSVPKTEERLLISITSEDPDEPYKKVSTSGGSSSSSSNSGGYEDNQTLGVPSNSQPVHHHQKRKPSITISIQDANINKQSGAGTQAVIVRPGDDGQSIVIATVGTSNNNKYKPPQTSVNDNIPLGAISSTNNQQQRPYTEPVNNPIHSIIAQHQITSTTRRPPVNDYNPPMSNQQRPIASTLVDQQRPPVQVTDERPQRPLQGGQEDRPVVSGYETLRPNSQPSSRPTSDPYVSGNADLSNEPSINDQYQGSSTSGNEEQQRKYPLSEKNCGIMHETRIVGGDVADPDDFMWMAAIIKSKPNNGEPRPFCGGSLITRRHILTAAHCLEGLAPRDVLVRLGSYDFEDSASSSSADYAIDQFRVPAQYSRKTHVADLAIMRLKTPLSPNDQYKTVCMPQPRRSYVGAYGLVTGYGSQSQTFRKAAPKLRQVTVPIWENRECSRVYNKTMGDSFLCAGYEAGGKDACQGDSGGPIMTEGPGQKMMIVGVVSHGIGCGSPGYPGVYTRTTTFADWIEKNTRE